MKNEFKLYIVLGMVGRMHIFVHTCGQGHNIF